MADTFSVDTTRLGQIPALLAGAQQWLAGQRCATTGWAAAGATGPGGNAAVGAFADSLDRFLAAGATALASDGEAVAANRAAYERTDLGAATSFGNLR